MFFNLNMNKLIYIFSNLLVLPATFIPNIDFISNVCFLLTFFLLIKSNVFFLLVVCMLFIIKNNSNYRFNLLLKYKGVEVSKSDYECVYQYAWCTLLRYSLIGIAINQVFIFLK